MRLPVLLLLAAVSAAAGCTLAPKYALPKVAAPATFGGAQWQAAVPADEQPRAAWWERYRDPVLDGLEARLERDSPELAAAVARYTAARALAVDARAGLFPYVGLAASANRDRQSDDRPLRSASQPSNYRDYVFAGLATYELDLWGRMRNLATIGRAGAQASAADLAAVRLSLEAELAADYLTLRGLDVELKLLDDTAAAYGRALELTRARHEGGIASGLDVARAEAQLQGAAAQVTDLHARRALLEHAIARLIGETPPEFAIAPQPQMPAVPAIPLGLPSTLVERRPDVAAAERRAAAANAAIGVARAAYFPRITLNATGGYESTSSSGWLAAPNQYWALGPQAALLLLDAGARHAQVVRARSAFDEAAARYRGTVLSAFQEVADNLSLLELLRQESAEESRAATAARRALALATDRYAEGAVSYLDVVVAQTAALQAERAELSLEVRQLTASVGLVRGLGGGWSVGELPARVDLSAVARPAAR
jgi:NodT family efflux transporter outer membrane factor (OMF) lipoprotein